jgi:hypothetical protein
MKIYLNNNLYLKLEETKAQVEEFLKNTAMCDTIEYLHDDDDLIWVEEDDKTNFIAEGIFNFLNNLK